MKALSLLLAIIPFLNSCNDNVIKPKEDSKSKIIIGESIESVKIGDDSLTVINKLGTPTRILDGDFNGFIYAYEEGDLKYTFVFISNDASLSLGVISISVESPYQKKTEDGIGIDSKRDYVLQNIGLPDTTKGEEPNLFDEYYYQTNTFVMQYFEDKIIRITMGLPKMVNKKSRTLSYLCKEIIIHSRIKKLWQNSSR